MPSSCEFPLECLTGKVPDTLCGEEKQPNEENSLAGKVARRISWIMTTRTYVLSTSRHTTAPQP